MLRQHNHHHHQQQQQQDSHPSPVFADHQQQRMWQQMQQMQQQFRLHSGAGVAPPSAAAQMNDPVRSQNMAQLQGEQQQTQLPFGNDGILKMDYLPGVVNSLTIQNLQAMAQQGSVPRALATGNDGGGGPPPAWWFPQTNSSQPFDNSQSGRGPPGQNPMQQQPPQVPNGGPQASPSLGKPQSPGNHLMNQGAVLPRNSHTAHQQVQQGGGVAPPFEMPLAPNMNGDHHPFPINGGQASNAAQMQQMDNENMLGHSTFPPLDGIRFDAAYKKFCMKKGVKLNHQMLQIEDRLVDMHLLHTNVIREGGWNKIDRSSSWDIIAARLGFVQFPGSGTEPAKSGPGVAQQIATIYKEFLHMFDQFYIRSAMQSWINMQNNANVFNVHPAGPSQPGNWTPQQTLQAVSYAHASVAEPRQQGLSQRTIQFVQTNRANLHQDQHNFQDRLRTNGSQPAATMNNQGNADQPGGPMGPPGLQPPSFVVPGQNHMLTDRQMLPHGINPVQGTNFMDDRQQAVQQQQLAQRRQGGSMAPNNLPTSEQMRLAIVYIAKVRHDFTSITIPNSPSRDVLPEQRATYNQILEELFQQTSAFEPKLPVFFTLLEDEELVKKLIAITCVVAHQRNLLSSAKPCHIISLDMLRGMMTETQRCMAMFQNVFPGNRQMTSPSPAAIASASTPVPAPTPSAVTAYPQAPASFKHPREDETVKFNRPSSAGESSSSAVANGPSPPKRVKLDPELQPQPRPPVEPAQENADIVGSVRTDEEAAKILDHNMTTLIRMASNGEGPTLSSDMKETLELLLRGYGPLGRSGERNGSIGMTLDFSNHREPLPPPSQSLVDEFSDLPNMPDDEDPNSKADTPELVSSSSPNTSAESNSEAAYYQSSDWKWDSPMVPLERPWADSSGALRSQPIGHPGTILAGKGSSTSKDRSAMLRGSAPFLHILEPSSQGPGGESTLVGESVLPKEGDKSIFALLSSEESAADAVQYLLKMVHGQKVEGSKPGNSVVTLHNIFSFLAHDKVACKPLLALRGDDAQIVLNALQWLLDCPKLHMLDNSGLLKLLLRLSKRSGLYPQCLTLKDIVREHEFAITAGHFGEIWKGRFRGRTVCLKVVKVYQKSQIDHLLKAFSKEAILWSQLNHRNVLLFYGVYHLGDEFSRICLVSPWMGHGNVRDYISNYPDVDRLLLVKDVGAGLFYLHQQGIVHGDLKGVNILVLNSGRSCLADFGLSNLVDSETLRWTSTQSTGHVGGTVRWQGPELFNPEDESAKPTRKSDIYSFACICYEIFTNKVPFHEVFRESTVIANVMAGKQPSKPDMYGAPYLRWGLTDAVWEMMEACWSRIPDARPTIQHIIHSQPFDMVIDQRPDDIEDQFLPCEFQNARYGSTENGSKLSD